MAVLLIRLRPAGDKRGSWFIECSDDVNKRDFKDRQNAEMEVLRLADKYPSILLISYSHWDRPEGLRAFRDGKWREIELETVKGW